MPFVQAIIPFQPAPDMWGATPIARSPSASVVPGIDRLEADICAVPPGGHISTLVSLGLDAGFAPARVRTLSVRVNALNWESGLAEAFFAWSHASAGLRIYIEEFSHALAYMRAVPGPVTTAFDLNAAFLGLSSTGVGARRNLTASLTMNAVPGNFYRIWVDALHTADCEAITGPASGVANAAFDFGPVFFNFV